MNIYIDDKKIEFTRTYDFKYFESKIVKFEIIIKYFSMKNMFKEISSLYKIELSSDNNGKITSMENAFYYCTNLRSFSFGQGWDTSQ